MRPDAPALPDPLLRHCAQDDSDIALELLSVDAAGWPHQAHLSVGEVICDPTGAIRVALWARSQAVANLQRTGQAVLMATGPEGVFEIRCHAADLSPLPDHAQLRAFRLVPAAIRDKSAPYADILSGIRFRLHTPEMAHKRWQSVRRALAAATPC